MRINKKIIESVWIDYKEGVRLKLRPTPLSIVFNNNNDISSIAKNRFVYAIEDWEGFEDTEGNVLVCNDDNKYFVFNYLPEITTFVVNYLDKLVVVQEEEIKN